VPLYKRKSIKSGSSVAVLIPAELQKITGLSFGQDVLVFFDERTPGVIKIMFGEKVQGSLAELDKAQSKVFEKIEGGSSE
jgi:antitoxin component of MazEF toxin-antitoxin module